MSESTCNFSGPEDSWVNIQAEYQAPRLQDTEGIQSKTEGYTGPPILDIQAMGFDSSSGPSTSFPHCMSSWGFPHSRRVS